MYCTQPCNLAAQRVSKRFSQEYSTELGAMVEYRVEERGYNRAEAQKLAMMP